MIAASLTAWRRRVGLVLQNADDQLFAPSVAEDVSFGPLNLGLGDGRDSRARRQLRWRPCTSRISPNARPTCFPVARKGGWRSPGWWPCSPEILLLDEPTAGLDHQGTEDLLAVLEELERSGTTLVFSTHDVELAYRFADEVAVFEGGKVLGQGPIATTLADAGLMRSALLDKPLLLKMGLHARELGLLRAGDPLPRTVEDALRLLDVAAVRERVQP